MKRDVKRSVKQSVKQSVKHCVKQSVKRSVKQSVKRCMKQSANAPNPLPTMSPPHPHRIPTLQNNLNNVEYVCFLGPV